jgi:hypothetical protein
MTTQGDVPMKEIESKQLLHLVFGGEVADPGSAVFKDVSNLHIVGLYPNYKEAYDAWRAAAQATVDNAQLRYFVVHIHRLLEPAPAVKP